MSTAEMIFLLVTIVIGITNLGLVSALVITIQKCVEFLLSDYEKFGAYLLKHKEDGFYSAPTGINSLILVMSLNTSSIILIDVLYLYYSFNAV